MHYLEVAKTDPVLAPYAKIRAARSRGRAGDVPGPWTRWAHHEITEWHFKEDSYAEASPHYAKAVESEVSLWWIDDVRMKQAKNDLVVPDRKQGAMVYFREVLGTTRWYDKRVTAARSLAKSDLADDRIRAALGLLRSGKYSEAGRVASSIPKTWLGEPHLEREWRRLSARLLIARGRKTEGRKQLEALALEHPKESWADKALLYSAISLIGAEKWDEVVRQLMRLYPDSASTREGMMRIARAHARYDHTDRAVEWYRQRVKLYADDEDTGAARRSAICSTSFFLRTTVFWKRNGNRWS